MPRKARIDAPGALHHIIVRGINRREIFFDDPDRDNFLNRLGDILSDSKTPCFAWALMTIPSLITEDRYRPHRYGNAQAFDRVCGEFQPASSSPWSLVSESIPRLNRVQNQLLREEIFLSILAANCFNLNLTGQASPFCARKILIYWNWCAIFT